MLTVHQALKRVLTAASPMPAERVPLQTARGRVLAEDVASPRDVPPWDNSAMDGFAVCRADFGDGVAELAVLETIGAGAVPTVAVAPGSCSRIMTGAPMPPGADAVVMIEDSEDLGGDRVRLSDRPRDRQHVRPRGGDVGDGEIVLRAGHVLDAAAVGMLSALGIPSVMVAQRPLVAVLSTGDEVVEVGWPLEPGQIYSSNTLSLMGLIEAAGCIPMHCGIAPDDEAGLRAALARCLRADLVLTTGGVSVGDFDHVKDAFDGSLDFWKVRMKPGKPLAFGRIGGRPAVGLPGNPVSCMVGFLQFVRPVLRTMLGDPRPYLPVLDATLVDDLRKKPGRVHFVRVRLAWGAEGLEARSTGTQSSGVLRSMVDADGFAVLPAADGDVAAGTRVPVQVLDWRWAAGADAAYGFTDEDVDHLPHRC